MSTGSESVLWMPTMSTLPLVAAFLSPQMQATLSPRFWMGKDHSLFSLNIGEISWNWLSTQQMKMSLDGPLLMDFTWVQMRVFYPLEEWHFWQVPLSLKWLEVRLLTQLIGEVPLPLPLATQQESMSLCLIRVERSLGSIDLIIPELPLPMYSIMVGRVMTLVTS